MKRNTFETLDTFTPRGRSCMRLFLSQQDDIIKNEILVP